MNFGIHRPERPDGDARHRHCRRSCDVHRGHEGRPDRRERVGRNRPLGAPRGLHQGAIRRRHGGATDAAPPREKRGRVCLAFDDVSKAFRTHGIFGARRTAESVVAADGISFTVAEGEIVALVGESGSGKTTAAKMAIGLVRPDFGKIAVTPALSRSDKVGAQMVFQHPKDLLDPLMKVGAQLHEVLKVHGSHSYASDPRLSGPCLRMSGSTNPCWSAARLI